jgi:predicted DNA-binding WGR domain protein
MRLYMQTQMMDNKQPRFYHIILEQDLLDGWNLVRETGLQGASGKVTRQHFQDLDEAQKMLVKVRDQQLKKGYRTVFAEGAILSGDTD